MLPTQEQSIAAVETAFTPQSAQQQAAVQAVSDAFGGKQTVQTPTTPPVVPDEPVTPTINADDLPTAQTPTVPEDRSAATLEEQIAGLIEQPIETPERDQQFDLIQQYISGSQSLGREAAEAEQLREQLGVNKFEAEIIDIAETSANIQQQLRQGELNRRKDGGLGTFLRSDINEARQQATIELEGLQAAQAIAESRFLSAERRVQNALKAKYEPIRLKLETLGQVINFNRDLMTSAEKSRADQKQNEINFALQKLQTRQAEEERATQTLTAIAQRGTADPREVARAFQQIARGDLTEADVLAQFSGALGARTEEERLNLDILRLQKAKYGQDLENARLDYAKTLQELVGASGELSADERETIIKSKPAERALAGVNAVALARQYQEMVESYGNTPTPKQRREAESFIRSTLAPTIAVARGQGALTDDEMNGFLNSYGVKGIRRRESVTRRNIQSLIDGLTLETTNNINAVDELVPGASAGIGTFSEFMSDPVNMSDEDFFGQLTNEGVGDSESSYFNF